MDPRAVRAAFDEQVRRRPVADTPDAIVECGDGVVRHIGGEDGWSGVTWSRLDAMGADAAIAAQIRRFAALSRPWEWKHYSHDEPPDLAGRLRAAGFAPQPAEALLVAAIADLRVDVPPPPGVELRAVRTERDVDELVAVHDAVFGGNHSALGRALAGELEQRRGTVTAVLACAGATPIAAGRVEFHAGTDFAGLWGGGTLPAWRGRGVFRSLVAHRAALASARGFRYLQVDASAESGPILRRLGFVELATTTPFLHPGTA